MNEIDLGEGDIGCTLEKMVSIRSNIHRIKNDFNTLIQCTEIEAILPLHASKGHEKQITVADGVPGKNLNIY